MTAIWRSPRRAPRGFTMAELIIVLAVIAIMVAVSVPYFLTYLQSARVRAAAEEIATFLNQGRQLAISTNQNICVHITSTAMHFHLANCAGTTWAGPGTDASGNIPAPGGIGLSTTADPVFSYLGNATPAATYTVRDTYSGRQLRVMVAASGRVSIGP
jgi:prepilin-type N-terminal cleavage/methylation domain-containing protein